MTILQQALSLIYPDQCALCDSRVDEHGGLCASCWKETHFYSGLLCESCGVDLPGEDEGSVICDDCLATPRPWAQGRAAIAYRGVGRRLVLALKHSDRLDLVKPAAQWMATSGALLFSDDTLFVPVPAHWTRLLSRRYNQAVELSRGLAKVTGRETLPDALVRKDRTPSLKGKSRDERFALLEGSIVVNEARTEKIRGRKICLIDDVMTSGATLSVATEELYRAGAKEVCMLVLARAEKTP